MRPVRKRTVRNVLVGGRKPTYRIVHRRMPRRYLVRMGKTATELLTHADLIFTASADLDTAVRDSVSQGLANVVEAAYDTEGCARGLSGEEFDQFRLNATAEWFRRRGYVEWFCEGAAVCFRSSKPRTMSIETVFSRSKKAGTRKPKAKTRKRRAGGNQ